jgi:galactonate dehydratase
VDLLIEMHGRFTPATAISVARELERFNPSWIEEPVPPENLAALEKVSRHVSIPVATGERIHVRHEFRELFERQAADIVQADITTCGGLLETKKISAWAESYYLLMAPHNVGGPISTAAALHLAATMPNFKIQEHFNDFAEAHVKQAAPGNPEVHDGFFALPHGPGLRVTLNEDVIREHPLRDLHFHLFDQDWHLRQAREAGTP